MGATADPVFTEQRPRLFGIAYRMLGSAHDAEDVVQDAWLRWAGAEGVESPPAWLATVVTRLCLTRLTSARARHEAYPGPWLPEPVLTPDPALGPDDTAAQRDSVSLALLVLMERLTPAERAVYVLREAFGHPHREIAGIVGVSEAHSRQLHRRAREHLDAGRRPPAPPDAGTWRRLVERFVGAARDGDLAGLERLLAADVVAEADGGGRVHAARRPVRGAAAVAVYLARTLGRARPWSRVAVAEVNGEPALLGWVDERLVGVVTVEVRDGVVARVRFLVNPDKLAFLERRWAAREQE